MTKQIIRLYETLQEITEKHTSGTSYQLTYQKSSKELNELHLTFNQVVNTLNTAISLGNQKDALPNFAKIYSEFGEFDKNHTHRGTCMANIGSIMLSDGDYIRAQQYFDESI